MLLITREEVNSINITWSQGSSPGSVRLATDVMHTFLLNITHGTSSQITSINESYYYFTAPESAPLCEIYNVSVTATYVGATYTGAGCSVPSPVLSTVLPSLPNIETVETSLNYSLSKQGKERIILNLTFEVYIRIIVAALM